MHEQVNIPDAVRRAVAQPLIVKQGDDFDNADALHEWGMMLGERWPLWALRAEAFRRLNGLPALTYPLSACVRSICRDEGLDSASSVEGLDALVDHRRVALVTGERFAWDSAELCEDEEARSWWSFGSVAFPRILDGPVLATYEPDTQYSIGGYDSPYEEIGLELMALLDARNAARSGTPERASANRRLGEFLVGVGGSVHGRPTVLRRAAARKLAEEGFPLFRALWEALATPVEINSRVQRVLRGLAGGSTKPEEWALRLVLPTFSALEIQAMLRNIRVTRGPRTAGMVSAEEFCMHVVAHRLATPIENVARKMKDGWVAEMLAASEGCAVCGGAHPGLIDGEDDARKHSPSRP